MQGTEKQVVKYDETEAAISEMSALYLDFTVVDVEDEKGFAEVELARKTVKAKRVAVEKQRKVFKADALEYGRKVDGEAKKLFALLEPIETHLTKEGDKVRNEIARIKAEEEAAEKAKIQKWVDDLLKVGVSLDYFTVATMADDDYGALYITAKLNFEAEQSRIAAAEKAKEEAEAAAQLAAEKEAERLAEVAKVQEAEAKRQEAVRRELEVKAAELQAAQDKIDADAKATQDAVEQEALLKRVAEQAEARAKKEAADEAERALEAEKKAKVEAERQESLKPDKEKLLSFVQYLQGGIAYPELSSDEANDILTLARTDIYHIGDGMMVAIEGL